MFEENSAKYVLLDSTIIFLTVIFRTLPNIFKLTNFAIFCKLMYVFYVVILYGKLHCLCMFVVLFLLKFVIFENVV